MSLPFKLDRIALAVSEAPAREEARRRAGASYSERHGADLLQLLGGRGRPRAVRAAAALLLTLELRRPWDARTRARLEEVVEAIERALTSGSGEEGRRAARHLQGLRRLAALDNAARNAAVDAALARGRSPVPHALRTLRRSC